MNDIDLYNYNKRIEIITYTVTILLITVIGILTFINVSPYGSSDNDFEMYIMLSH